MSWETFWATVCSWIMSTGLKLVIAIVLLMVSFRLLDKLGRKLTARNAASGKLDKTLARTLIYAGTLAAKILVTVCLVSYVGIDTSGITALIASLGVCVGLAVNGALGNVAGGILLLVTRPFRVGDFIEVAGFTGTVEDIFLCNTKLVTPDNRVVIVPNSAASSSSVVNYSTKELRRVDQVFSIAYENDYRKAEAILTELLSSHAKVLSDPAPFVRLSAHNDSSIDITCRAWVKAADYWDVYFDMLASVKERFDQENISIPYPQMDVHVKND